MKISNRQLNLVSSLWYIFILFILFLHKIQFDFEICSTCLFLYPFSEMFNSLGKKVQIRKPAPGLSDIAPLRRTSRPVIISSSTLKKATTQHRPIRERLTHLLALKPYKKPELILRLQKDGLSQLDKDSLDSHLQQVKHTHSVSHLSLTVKFSLLIILNWRGW